MFKKYFENVRFQKALIAVSAIIRIFIGAFLMFSAYAKYISSEFYLKFIMRLGILPAIALKSVIPLIIFEFLFGILLIVGYKTKIMLRAASILFLIFTSVVTYSMILGIDVSCGCFGPYFQSEISYFSIGRNFIVAIITFLISLYKYYPFTLDSYLSKRLFDQINT
ncbi:MAG: MauE/DoxX family redox-associated membrane protein [Bacteroidota bacterium]